MPHRSTAASHQKGWTFATVAEALDRSRASLSHADPFEAFPALHAILRPRETLTFGDIQPNWLNSSMRHVHYTRRDGGPRISVPWWNANLRGEFGPFLMEAEMTGSMLVEAVSFALLQEVVAGTGPRGEPGLWIEPVTARFECLQCGSCCDLPDAYQTDATREDLRRWRREGRFDILDWVEDGVLWINPRTGWEASGRCPWIRKRRGKDQFLCRIHGTKPEKCQHYPTTVRHGASTGCPGCRRLIPPAEGREVIKPEGKP